MTAGGAILRTQAAVGQAGTYCEDSLSEHLRLSGVSHGYGDRQLFAGVDVAITAGEHVAIVGENGAGKSTLLRILAGFEAPDEGTSVSHGRVGYLAQTHGMPEQFTVSDAIDAALESLRALEAELDRLEDGLAGAEADELERYGNLQTQYQLREGYAAESRVEAALDRLGLGGLDRMRTLGSLSGGEQERVALACVLADPADILLLDEPTNHLDASGTAWLEARLAAHRGTVVVVSHDRVLLRKVASTVIEVDAERRSVNRYGNGYEGYLREKAAERQRWAQQYHGWLDAMAAERLQADTVAGKMGYARQRDGDKMGFDFKAGTWQKAATSKVRNAQERLRRLEANPIDRPPVPLKLATDLRADVADGPALEAKGVAVPGRLAPTDFRVEAGQKILITGPNGAGKSTLLLRPRRHAGTGPGQSGAGTAGSATCSRSWNSRSARDCGSCPPLPRAWAAISMSTPRRCCAWGSSGPANSTCRWAAFPRGSNAGWRWPGSCWAGSGRCWWTSPPTTWRPCWWNSLKRPCPSSQGHWSWSATTARWVSGSAPAPGEERAEKQGTAPGRKQRTETAPGTGSGTRCGTAPWRSRTIRRSWRESNRTLFGHLAD